MLAIGCFLKWSYIMYLVDKSLEDDAKVLRFMTREALLLILHGNRTLVSLNHISF